MRREVLDKLIEWSESKNRLPLILQGARQVGKTYLLTEFGKEHFEKLHYFNFEEQPLLCKIFEGDLSPARILRDLRIDAHKLGKELIFFDEIQACPKALTALKYFSEQAPEVYVCAAGSLLGVAFSEESYPVGKVQHLYLTPLKFGEFLSAYDPWLSEILTRVISQKQASTFEHEKLLDAWRLYAAVGGMPKAVLQLVENAQKGLVDMFSGVADIQKNLLISYHSDFTKHAGKVNAAHIGAVFGNVPSQLSKNIDGSTKRYVFKDILVNKKGFAELSAPIDWLVKAGLVYKTKVINRAEHPLESFSADNLFKLYYFDSGLLGRALNIPLQTLYLEEYGFAKGYFVENAVLTQLINSSMEAIYCWQENKAEVEFVQVINGKIVPLEIKSSANVQSKSLNSFISRYAPDLVVRISQKNFGVAGNSIHALPLYASAFLNKLI